MLVNFQMIIVTILVEKKTRKKISNLLKSLEKMSEWKQNVNLMLVRRLHCPEFR